jgi:hypothetical protein
MTLEKSRTGKQSPGSVENDDLKLHSATENRRGGLPCRGGDPGAGRPASPQWAIRLSVLHADESYRASAILPGKSLT